MSTFREKRVIDETAQAYPGEVGLGLLAQRGGRLF